jgi:hypothetical protein
MGIYLGNDFDNRQITGLGFRPVHLIIQCGINPSCHRTLPVTGDATLSFQDDANYSDGIQAILTDGFEVGTSLRVNENLKFCHYVAFGGTYTAVRLASLSTIGLEDQVLIEWETETEVDTAGFNVLRADSPEGPWGKLNEDLIPGRGTSWDGASYAFADAARVPGAVRWYCVEEVDVRGGTVRYPSKLVWDDGLADEDGDGMPDAWERPLGIDSMSAADADADADGDGVSNLAEYLAGTSPIDAEDCPRLKMKRAGEEGLPGVAWPGRVGRTYMLQAADTLAELLYGSPMSVCTMTVTSSSPMQLEGLPDTGGRMRFYRLLVSPPQ